MTMKAKYAIFAVLVVFWVLAMNSSSQAVDKRKIDRVRSKGVLDSGDLRIIDKFIAESVQELVNTEDFTSIGKIRTVILSRKSTQAQYAEQFSESAYKHISAAFEQASKLAPESRRFRVILNLLILIDGMEDLRVADLAMKLLSDKDMAIRYWAVHSVTNAGIVKQLNSTESASLKLARRIVKQLKGLVVDNSCPEILALIAEFAADVDVPEGGDLLLQIADVRMSQYADWIVDYEFLDGVILKLLYSKMYSAGKAKPAVARRFAQLYSYAIQRYIKDINKGSFLSATDRQRLASVLVETEKSCIGKILGMPQSVIKKAVERSDATGLLLEHSRLLGDETRAGQLSLKLNFDYGQNSDGSRRTAPLVLPEPPKAKAVK